MVTEPKLKQCLNDGSFKILDNVHCNLDAGADTLKAHVGALRSGKKKGVDRSIDFLQGAVDRIDSGLGLGNNAEVPGFGGHEAVALKETMDGVTKQLAVARKTGAVPPDVLRVLDNIAFRAKELDKKATILRSENLFTCLTGK